MDGLNTRTNLQYAPETWVDDFTRDVVLYLVGSGGLGFFDINSSEIFSASDLNNRLDSLQNRISGRINFTVYDAPRAESFTRMLYPPPGRERLLIAGAGTDLPACFAVGGDISFSCYFWKQVANGACLRDTFRHAANALAASRLSPAALVGADESGRLRWIIPIPGWMFPETDSRNWKRRSGFCIIFRVCDDSGGTFPVASPDVTVPSRVE